MSPQVSTYVTEDQLERWDEMAEEMGMSRSEWISSMTEAGTKKFSRDVEPDANTEESRKKRNDLLRELKRARNRVEKLETQLHLSDRETLLEFLEENPGSEYRDVVQHVANTVNSRVATLLDQMEGDDIEIDGQGRLYQK